MDDAGRTLEVEKTRSGEEDPRLLSAWKTWLSALGTDAHAAMAAAMAYESLPAEARDAWLDALEVDAPTVSVPRVALYAPLLAVEQGSERRTRILRVLSAESALGVQETRAFRGVTREGHHVCLLVSPLYLDFAEVLVCRYTPHGGFLEVRHDPLRHMGEIPEAEHGRVDGTRVEETPLRVVIEELSHAVLADRRERREAPRALAAFAHLFGPRADESDHVLY